MAVIFDDMHRILVLHINDNAIDMVTIIGNNVKCVCNMHRTCTLQINNNCKTDCHNICQHRNIKNTETNV